VIIPYENEKDLKEVPAKIRRGIEISTVEHMDDVLRMVFPDMQERVFPEENLVMDDSFHLKQ
jgi:ATP-dependent Lon protease